MIIILCVRWYLRYSLSDCDLEEMMAERGLAVDHVTIWRWVQRYAPILNQRLERERRRPRSWRVDETYIRVAGRDPAQQECSVTAEIDKGTIVAEMSTTFPLRNNPPHSRNKAQIGIFRRFRNY